MAVGVASPIAHGQAIIKTATKLIKALIGNPKIYQATNVATAIINTIGTKYEETISAILCIGALVL